MEYSMLKFWSLIPPEQKICKICKCQLTPQNVDIHHKDGKRFNNNAENLELLCQMCHRGYKKNRNLPTITITFRLSMHLLEIINDEADKNGTSVSLVIRQALQQYFKKPMSLVRQE